MMKRSLNASLKHIFERQTHPYYMWDGIQSIPDGMTDILAPKIVRTIQASAAEMIKKSPIHLIGCGTSYFAAIAIAYAIEQIAGLSAYPWEAFEFLAYPPVGIEQSCVIGISHTGSTPPVVQAMEMARKLGACTVGYTDGISSALTRAGEWAVLSTMGLEPALPKTRSYTSMLMRGYLQAIELARRNAREVQLWESALNMAPRLANQVLSSVESQVKGLAERWVSCRRIIVSGGGPQYATALEGSLKITEASISSSVSWEIEEAVHGTWASTEREDLLILLAVAGPSFESAVRLAGGMKTIGCKVWVLTDRPWDGAAVDAVTELPAGEPELFMPLYAIIPLYEFSYFAALSKKISPDNMRLSDPRYLDARTQMRTSLT